MIISLSIGNLLNVKRKDRYFVVAYKGVEEDGEHEKDPK